MKLVHDLPESRGVENALKRAKQMVDFPWTPVRPCPIGTRTRDSEGKRVITNNFTAAWRPQTGINYSSVRIHEKYVGYNVSFETFVTALANPCSVMYTQNQHGKGKGMFAYYGSVCSAFASYVMGLSFRLPCEYWPDKPGVNEVDMLKLENLRLGDLLLKRTKHIAVVTDILRDENRRVRYITVSEETKPQCVATTYTPEEFRNYWLKNGYQVYRYDGIHDVTYTPSPYVYVEGDPELPVPEINSSLMPDFGNRANYMLGECVEIDVLEPGWTDICITGPSECVLPIVDKKVIFIPEKPGFYTACCTDGTKKSECVEFCVTLAEVRADRQTYSTEEPVSIDFDIAADEDEPLGWLVQNETHNIRHRGEFTKWNKSERTAVIEGLAPGDYYVVILVKNPFGVYKSSNCYFRIQ